jgi:hypothetical protein
MSIMAAELAERCSGTPVTTSNSRLYCGKVGEPWQRSFKSDYRISICLVLKAFPHFHVQSSPTPRPTPVHFLSLKP